MGLEQNGAVRTWTQGKVLIVAIAHPPVNALSAAVRRGLLPAFERGRSDPMISAIVLSGDGRYFSGGADITEFGAEEAPPTLDAIFECIDAMQKPVLAALNGPALGGGFELALVCHYRVIADQGEVGLPEVKLGLIPGLGGTQRLPRVAGLAVALDLIGSGRRVGPGEAAEAGVAVPLPGPDFLDRAVAFAAARAQDLTLGGQRPPRLRDQRVEQVSGSDAAALLLSARTAAGRKQRGFQAPLRCIEAIEAAVRLPFDEGLRLERQLFMESLASEESAALTHLFFAERAARAISGVPANTTAPVINQVAVIGGGTMGRGIAIAMLLAGIRTVLIEADEARLSDARAAILAYFDKLVTRGQWSEQRRAALDTQLSGAVELAAVTAADMVIEAVYEDIQLKTDLFGALDKLADPNAILATNTSGLDINIIAAATERASRVVGLHFFSPAHIMRLVEVVRGKGTAPGVLKACVTLAQRLQKVPVVARVCDGFIGNRIFDAYWREAEFLVEAGADPGQVDGALVGFGMAMGPFTVSDLAGLDIGHAIRTRHALRLPASVRAPGVEEFLYQHGRLGQKNGRGWYDYDPGTGAKKTSEEASTLIRKYRESTGAATAEFSAEDIVIRCISALINEAAKVLEEGIAERASDIDLVAVHGYGFPAYRGGPMFYAQTVGLGRILSTVTSEASGANAYWWRPAKLLQQIVMAAGDEAMSWDQYLSTRHS